MLKITHIFWGLTYGGIETMLVNIMNEQVKAGVEVSVIFINKYYADELLRSIDPHIRIYTIDRIVGSKSLSFIGKINKTLDQAKPDVIHIHSAEISNFIAPRWRTIICCTLHALPIGKKGVSWRALNLVQWMLNPRNNNVRSIQMIPHVFSISKSVEDQLRKDYGVESTVVMNGIKTNEIKIRPREMYQKCFRIVQVSRLYMHIKGQDLLLEAASRLVKDGVTNFNITFIGDGQDMDNLKEMASNLGVKQYVEFVGTKEHEYITENLAGYDLFVQPSRYEGFGLTVTEAMAAGVPVLVSSGQGPAEIVGNGVYGQVFENGDAVALAGAITSIMKNYEEALNRAALAKEMVERDYSVQHTAARYIEEYKKIVN